MIHVVSKGIIIQIRCRSAEDGRKVSRMGIGGLHGFLHVHDCVCSVIPCHTDMDISAYPVLIDPNISGSDRNITTAVKIRIILSIGKDIMIFRVIIRVIYNIIILTRTINIDLIHDIRESLSQFIQLIHVIVITADIVGGLARFPEHIKTCLNRTGTACELTSGSLCKGHIRISGISYIAGSVKFMEIKHQIPGIGVACLDSAAVRNIQFRVILSASAFCTVYQGKCL